MREASSLWKTCVLRLQPFWEASAFVLAWGLLDIHNSSRLASDFLLLPTFVAAAFSLGFRHAGRGAWLCWAPLGLGVYCIHLAAIQRGYLPPFVEKDALAARATIGWFFPAAGDFLFLGVLARVGASACGWMRRDGEPVRILPRSMRGLIAGVAVAGVVMMLLKWAAGVETVYAPGFNESRFQQIRPGMSASEVETWLGKPLKKLPWGEGRSAWWYSVGASSTSDHWRRWVIIENDRVDLVISDYWYD